MAKEQNNCGLTGIQVRSHVCDHFQTSFILELVAMSVFALKLLMLMFMKAPGHRKDTCPPRIRSLYTSIKKLIVVFTVLLFFSVMDTEAEAGVWKTVVGRGCLVYVHRHRQQIHFQRKG